jgi:hypothetical protein
MQNKYSSHNFFFNYYILHKGFLMLKNDLKNIAWHGLKIPISNKPNKQ